MCILHNIPSSFVLCAVSAYILSVQPLPGGGHPSEILYPAVICLELYSISRFGYQGFIWWMNPVGKSGGYHTWQRRNTPQATAATACWANVWGCVSLCLQTICLVSKVSRVDIRVIITSWNKYGATCALNYMWVPGNIPMWAILGDNKGMIRA